MAGTTRERGRPSREIDMAKPIGNGDRLGRPLEDQFCCWPTCYTAVVDFPLCNRHQIKAYVRISEHMDRLVEEFKRNVIRDDPRTKHVYFVRYRDRVKIGYSIEPQTRIKAHPCDEILAIVPGDHKDEQRYHKQFAHLRENGEWFRAEPELLEYAHNLAA